MFSFEAEAQTSSAQAALNYKLLDRKRACAYSLWPLPHDYCEKIHNHKKTT